MRPVLELVGAGLSFGERTVWSGLDLAVAPGEFVTVLGPNGSGKTTLLRAVLGQVPLSAGRIAVMGHPPRRGSRIVGYVPQQRIVDPATPVRARDLVRLGVDGDRWGPGRHDRRFVSLQQMTRVVPEPGGKRRPRGRFPRDRLCARQAARMLGQPLFAEEFLADRFVDQKVDHHGVRGSRTVGHDDRAGYEVHVVPTDKRRKAKPTVIRCDQVVLAAGTYGTQTLLHHVNGRGGLPRISAQLGELIAKAIADKDETYNLFKPFGFKYTGGALGPLVAQAAYHSWELGDMLRHLRTQLRVKLAV